MKTSNLRPIAALSAWLLSATVGILIVSCGTAPTPVQKTETPKTTAKKCLDCHPEFADRYSKGNVHSPVADGDCFACHRPHGIFGKILFRAEQPTLCYPCHKDVQPKETAKTIHKPLTTSACTECHNPHNSDHGALLAAEEKESCFACHGREDFQQQFVHAPMAEGCKSCHNPHSSENASLLLKSPDATCLACHDANQPKYVQAHFQYPVRTGCSLCHTPHSSSTKSLLKKVVHDPVRKGMCDSCHTVEGNTAVRTKPDPDRLCLQCHDITQGGASIHPPYVQGKCTTCHDVHASNYTAMLADAPERICQTCHTDVAGDKDGGAGPDEAHPGAKETAGKSRDEKGGDKTVPGTGPKAVSQHQPVVDGKCLACHKGHTADQQALLKTDQGKLCLDCHEQQAYGPAGGSHPPDNSQMCATCHLPHQSGLRKLLKGQKERDLCYTCHKSTSVERGRFSLHAPFAQGKCGACHQLHRPKAAGFLSEAYGGGKLCATCHDQAQQGTEHFISHAPVSQGQCSTCHSPHAADYDHILLKSESELCFQCHQRVRQSHEGAKVQHKPLVDGKCTDCHTAHGSTYANILKQNQPKLCLNCHSSVAEFWVKGSYHEPAAKNCLQCHTSHGSDLKGMLAKPSGELCSQCHDQQNQAFGKAHNQITPKPDSCVSCHSPHGSPVKSMLYPVAHKPFEERSCSPCHSGR